MFVVLFITGNVWAATLRAGVAKVNITPPPGVPMWGFSDRKSPATGTLDPLYARVLVLEASGKRLALVSVDLGRPFGPASFDWLRRATQDDVSFLILAATHTHSAPVVQDENPNGPAAWESAALKGLEALAPAAPYELGSLSFVFYLYPVYLRGEAYLATHQGSAAAAEFQKILDHACVVLNSPIG